MIGASGELVVSINLPSGYHFTKGANSRYEVVVEPPASADSVSVESMRGSLRDSGLSRIKFKRTGAVDPGTTLNVNCKIYYCQQEDLCLFKQVSFEVPVETNQPDSTTKQAIDLAYSVRPPASTPVFTSTLTFD